MARLEVSCGTLLVLLNLSAAGITSLAVAAPPTGRIASGESGPSRVEVALVGALEEDPPLFERIRSLFPNETAVVLRSADQLEPGTVLRPERADTLYLWIRMGSRLQARVYAAAREMPTETARFLFRDVRLESGLDEVGSESLAQIAHSSAEALWRREEESPKHQVEQALESERVAGRDAAPAAARSTLMAARPGTTPSLDAGAARALPARPRPFNFGFGAGFSTHWSGVEGWLFEPGVFVTTQFLEHFSVSAAALYLMPADFDVLPARVRLSGASGELRFGWAQDDPRAARVRFEAGLSLLIARWSSTIAASEPPARANSPRAFMRPSALAAGAFEWPLGPAWVGARAELRVPLRNVRYEVEGSSAAAENSGLSPGGALEFGLVLDTEGR